MNAEAITWTVGEVVARVRNNAFTKSIQRGEVVEVTKAGRPIVVMMLPSGQKLPRETFDRFGAPVYGSRNSRAAKIVKWTADHEIQWGAAVTKETKRKLDAKEAAQLKADQVKADRASIEFATKRLQRAIDDQETGAFYLQRAIEILREHEARLE